MAKLKSSLLNMFLSLTVICAVAGGILAAVDQVTGAPIAASKKAKLENAIRAVVPEFDNSPTEDAYMGVVSDGDSLKIYPAKKGGQLVGVAVESNSMKGFSGEIKVIFGLDVDGKIYNYSVLEHAETPGLGSKMEEWFRAADKGRQSVLGKNLSKGTLKVTKDGGDIDAITAATITSRAFLDAAGRAYTVYAGTRHNDASSGATSNISGNTTGNAGSQSGTTTATGNDSIQSEKGAQP